MFFKEVTFLKTELHRFLPSIFLSGASDAAQAVFDHLEMFLSIK